MKMLFKVLAVGFLGLAGSGMVLGASVAAADLAFDEPEPMSCYGLAPRCDYPSVQCCIDNQWTCCTKRF